MIDGDRELEIDIVARNVMLTAIGMIFVSDHYLKVIFQILLADS